MKKIKKREIMSKKKKITKKIEKKIIYIIIIF